MADPNIQIPSLPAAGNANLTDLLVARQGTEDKKLTIQLVKDLLLNGNSFDAATILTLLLGVDGSGSGLDADLLDGQQGSFYRNANNLSSGLVPANRLSAATLLDKIKGVDGTGSGLDADLLDAQEGSFYRNANNLNAGTVPSARISASDVFSKVLSLDGPGSGLDADLLDGEEGSYYTNATNLSAGTVASARVSGNYPNANINATNLYTGTVPADRLNATTVLNKILSVDGSGSGLDADLLDGEQGSFYRDADNLNAGTVASTRISGNYPNANTSASNLYTGTVPAARLNATDVLNKVLSVDGSGSGLDADLLDGQQGTYYNAAANLTGTVPSANISGNYPNANVSASNLYTGTVPSARLPASSTTLAGIIEQATQAEVNSGSAGSLAVIASTLRNNVQYSLGNEGYIRFPSWLGGFTLQWGNRTVGGNGSAVETFPIAFSNVFQVVASIGTDVGSSAEACSASSITNTNFFIRNADGATNRINWIAIGVS